MTMKPISSLTTTLQKGVSLSTQKERTSTGSEMQLTSEQKTNALNNLKKIKYPAETDQALRFMLDSITNSQTNIRYTNLYLPTDNNKEFPSWSEVAAITNQRKKRREDILTNIERKENSNAITDNTS